MEFASCYVLYHWLLIAFFDGVPRFNTPYLVFYLIIGVAGLTRVFNNYGNVHQ